MSLLRTSITPLERQPCSVSESQAPQLPGLYLGWAFPPVPGACVDFDGCWVPERWFGDFAFRSLVSFYFPPLFSLTDSRALSASGPCSFFFLGP